MYPLRSLPPCACRPYAPLHPCSVRDPQLECFYEAMRALPSLHIIGERVGGGGGMGQERVASGTPAGTAACCRLLLPSPPCSAPTHTPWQDPVKPLTNRLISSFDSPVVISHPRGHVIPALQGQDLARLRAFLQQHRREAATAGAAQAGAQVAAACERSPDAAAASRL